MAKVKLFKAGFTGPKEIGGLGVVMFTDGVGDAVLDDTDLRHIRLINRVRGSEGIKTVRVEDVSPSLPKGRPPTAEQREACNEESPGVQAKVASMGELRRTKGRARKSVKKASE